MNVRTLSVLALAALLLTAGTATAVVIGSPDIDATLADNTVSPGEETTLEVVLVNSGELQSGSNANPSLNNEVTTAQGLTVAVRSGEAPISVTTSRQAIGALPKGSPSTVAFDISVDDDASPGTYRVPISLSYDYTDYISESDGTRQSESVDNTVRYVTLQVSDDATFDVTDVDSNARVDSTGTVAVTVENTGREAASNAAVTLASQNAELGVGGGTESSRFVDAWEPGEQRTFRYKVSASDQTEPEPYEFDLSVEFDDADGVRTTSQGTSVGIAPAPEQSFSLSNVETSLRAGTDGNLEATLTNTGDETVENVVVNWKSDHTNLSPQETQYAVGTLGPGESATVNFGVDASDSADAGPRQFDFTASYRDGNGDRRESDTLEIRAPVEGQVDEFDVDASGTTVQAGQSTVIELTVENAGEERLTDISAKLFADSPISANDDEAFVAALSPGESTTLTFSISAGGGALDKTYPISLDFRYEEPDGDTPISDTYRVPIQVTTEDGGSGGLLGIAGGAGLLALLAIGGYVRFR